MIKFFRKIRQRLLTENKFSKYLLYAIGEIILVVIGILIALSINNWNEEIKQRANDVKFLKNLRNEIKLDTTVLTEKIYEYKLINEKLNQTLYLLDNRPSGLTENEREIMIAAIIQLEFLTPAYKNIERNDIKLTNGTLVNINNQLSQKYLNYLEKTKSNNDIISKLGESLQLIALKDINPKVDLNYSNRTSKSVDFDIAELRNDRGFKNAINRSLTYRHTSIEFMQQQKEKANELLLILNKELN